MPNEAQGRIIEFTPEFKRNIRRLSRKYRGIRSDIEPVITDLENGETPGDQIAGTGYTIFKIRVQNSDIRKGKRSGYRLIYYLATHEKVILLTIYSKSDQGDISSKRLREIVIDFEENIE